MLDWGVGVGGYKVLNCAIFKHSWWALWLLYVAVNKGRVCCVSMCLSERERDREKHACAYLHISEMLLPLSPLHAQGAELALPVLRTLCPSPYIDVCTCAYQAYKKKRRETNPGYK